MTMNDPPEFRMSGHMSQEGQSAVLNLVETESADCVVVLYTKQVHGRTVAVMNHFGNEFIVRGVLEAAAEAVLGWGEEDEDETDG